MNTEVSSIITQLGLSQYLGAFVDEGFDTWEALLDIQESDLLPDQNAPERPPTAYVRFSNKIREGLKDQNITFAEKAKLVGENWQTLAPGEKAEYESRAKAEKDQYRLQLEAYQKTDNHRQYSQYLSEFKQEVKRNGKRRDYERQKLEPRPPGYGSSISSRVEARSGVGASVTSKEFDKCRVNQIPAISEPTLKRIHNHISSFQTHLANGRVKPGDDHSQLPPLTLEHRKERDNSPESALMLSVARASRIDKARLGGQAQTTSRATHQLRRHEVVPTLPDDLQGGLRSRTSKQSTSSMPATEESTVSPSLSRGTTTTNTQGPQPNGPTANTKGTIGYGTSSLRSLSFGRLANKHTMFRVRLIGVSKWKLSTQWKVMYCLGPSGVRRSLPTGAGLTE
ncbi:hypothetical protein PCL_12669 [Purpureocillium lilacinum]|uniref:HMG box domain-containing protein n=1 Tax=Purpureocillium lilacinum TaxID=33203 RepID=A0A2U3DPC9_PURLI|nr:hypothetical protein PCL_12669 [Purpureocillium lilacinum]